MTRCGGMAAAVPTCSWGGSGDDSCLWRGHGEGNDFFHGGEGEGKDTIRLWNLGETLEQNWERGDLNLALTDADGNNVDITADMFDSHGNLNLPEGLSGILTGPMGNTLTFDRVEKITKHQHSKLLHQPAIPTSPGPEFASPGLRIPTIAGSDSPWTPDARSSGPARTRNLVWATAA